VQRLPDHTIVLAFFVVRRTLIDMLAAWQYRQVFLVSQELPGLLRVVLSPEVCGVSGLGRYWLRGG